MQHRRMRKIAFLWISVMLLTGCVTLPRGYGDAELESSIRERLKDDFKIPVEETGVEAIQVTIDTLVTLDEAVGIALSNNPSIRAFYAELSIAKAEAVGATLPDNPVLRGEFLATSGNAGEKTTIAVNQNVVDLLLMPLKKRVAKGRIYQRRLYIAHKILDAVVEVKTSYLGYQRDLQILELHRSVVATAEAEAELSKRQFGEGNINALDLARHQDVLHDAKLELIRAEAEVRHSKELVRRLLSFDTDG
ncbi:MAG: TolC family protein, partial [Candidatus Marinimicrobia bacterium]|nr:TolC family protein [Candidatus Neomarinimicrobiota bacterium]